MKTIGSRQWAILFSWHSISLGGLHSISLGGWQSTSFYSGNVQPSVLMSQKDSGHAR